MLQKVIIKIPTTTRSSTRNQPNEEVWLHPWQFFSQVEKTKMYIKYIPKNPKYYWNWPIIHTMWWSHIPSWHNNFCIKWFNYCTSNEKIKTTFGTIERLQILHVTGCPSRFITSKHGKQWGTLAERACKLQSHLWRDLVPNFNMIAALFTWIAPLARFLQKCWQSCREAWPRALKRVSHGGHKCTRPLQRLSNSCTMLLLQLLNRHR